MDKEKIKRLISFLIFVFLFGLGFGAQAGEVAPPAINYAPSLWFDSEEEYYPVNILDFYFEDGEEIEGEKAVEKYNNLSQEEKLDNIVVFYHVLDTSEQWVYQYWFFYVYNYSRGLIPNQHSGDWESVFVFVNKNTSKVTSVIGTAHQRKLFDTEIYNPKMNHIWSYIGSGSHANCVDNRGDSGEYNSFRWWFFDEWNKDGIKVFFDDYNLTQITPSFIDQFKGAKTLEKSERLGINIFNFLEVFKIKVNTELYIPWGDEPPVFAWKQESFTNPEVLRPVSGKLITEYISNKISNTKNRITGFFSDTVSKIKNIFKKDELSRQGASISSVVSDEVRPLQGSDLVTLSNLPLSEQVSEIVEENIVPELEIKKEEVVQNPIVVSPEPVEIVEIIEEPEVIVEPATEEIVESEIIEEEIVVEETVTEEPAPTSNAPFGLSFFPGGGSAPAPQGDTTPPDAPIVTSHNSGDKLATTTVELIGTAEADSIILITSPSDYSTTTNGNGDWQQSITLSEGENTVLIKAEDGSGNQSDETSLTLNIDTTAPSDITDLSSNPGDNRGEIDLAWTAPGGDEYILRYSTSSEVTSLNWASSTDITGEPIPSESGSSESLTISNLDTSQIYYWAIKTEDDMDNSSDVSNSASSTPSGLANDLVISEIQVRGGSYENDEFIEIYNPTDSNIDLSSYSIQYRGSEAVNFYKKNFESGNSIPSDGFFLIANTSYNGHMVADMSHGSFSMSKTGGNIFLVNNQILLTDPEDNSIVDKVAYGSGAYLFPETSEFSTAPGQEQSLERKNKSTSTAELLAVNGNSHWQGNNWDGDNNSSDFVLQTNPNPQNSLSLIEPRNNFASLADTACPMIQCNISHTGLSQYSNSNTGSPTSTPKWTINLGVTDPNTPAIGLDGSIYVGANSGDLYKITADGNSSKFYDTGTDGDIKTPVFSSDGFIYFVNATVNDPYLYAVDSNEQLVWKYGASNESSEPVIGPDGTIYIADDFFIYALTPNGEEIWQSELLSNGRWVRTPVIDSDGILYTAGKIGNGEYVYAINQSDGTIKWQSGNNGYSTALSLDNGILYVGTESNGLYALNSSDGSQKWVSSMGDNISNPIPTIIGDHIYIGTDGYAFYDISKTDGSTNWTFAEFDDKVYAPATVDSNGVIYIGGQDKMFYALNPDKSIKWQAELSDKINYGAVIDSNGIVYVVTIDGNVYAFGQ